MSSMKFQALLVSALCAFLVSGCVSYRLGVAFDWWGGGSVEQLLTIDSTLLQAGGTQAEQLIAGLRRRTAELGGTSERSGDQLRLTIPFTSGDDLEQKLNRSLGQPLQTKSPSVALPAPTTSALKQTPTAPATGPLRLVARDYWLWSDYQISADLDLRSPFGAVRTVNLVPGLLQIEFVLSTPLPALRSNSQQQQGQTLIWQIQPGEVNHLEASFVVPNLALIGLLVLVAALVLFTLLRRRQLTWQRK